MKIDLYLLDSRLKSVARLLFIILTFTYNQMLFI